MMDDDREFLLEMRKLCNKGMWVSGTIAVLCFAGIGLIEYLK